MNPTVRSILVVVGVLCFAVGAGAAFGAWSANVTGCALAGFACWLASTLP